MKTILMLLAAVALAVPAGADEGWVSMFDGATLAGWKSNDEVKDVFGVEDGALRVSGGRAHLFYVGPAAACPKARSPSRATTRRARSSTRISRSVRCPPGDDCGPRIDGRNMGLQIPNPDGSRCMGSIAEPPS